MQIVEYYNVQDNFAKIHLPDCWIYMAVKQWDTSRTGHPDGQTQDRFLEFSNHNYQTIKVIVFGWQKVAFYWLFVFTWGQFWRLGIVVACICVCLSVCVCVNHLLVRYSPHDYLWLIQTIITKFWSEL